MKKLLAYLKARYRAHREKRRTCLPQSDRKPASPTFDLHRKLSAEEINSLRREVYKGPIHMVRSREELPHAIRELAEEKLLGFDTETRPSFRKGESHAPALLQLAGQKAVYIFVLHTLGLPVELTRILADHGIIKAGVAVGRDIKELRAVTDFEPGGFVDLGKCAEKNGIQHHGFRGLAALLLGCRISKGAQLTNWERADLPDHALQYAATDAWIGRRIYEAMKQHGVISPCTHSPNTPVGKNARDIRLRSASGGNRRLTNRRIMNSEVQRKEPHTAVSL